MTSKNKIKVILLSKHHSTNKLTKNASKHETPQEKITSFILAMEQEIFFNERKSERSKPIIYSNALNMHNLTFCSIRVLKYLSKKARNIDHLIYEIKMYKIANNYINNKNAKANKS